MKMSAAGVQCLGGSQLIQDSTVKSDQITVKPDEIEAARNATMHDVRNLVTLLSLNMHVAGRHTRLGDPLFDIVRDSKNALVQMKNLLLRIPSEGHAPRDKREILSVEEVVVDATRFALRGRHVRCSLHFPDDLYMIFIDRVQFNQVLHNLILNACQAMGSEGRIRISACNVEFDEIPHGATHASTKDQACGAMGVSGHKDARGNASFRVKSKDRRALPGGSYVLLKIRDFGKGIPRSVRDRIFEPLFTTKPKGNGIGLATCLSMIRLHGGDIRVKSRVGVGTLMKVYLPASCCRLGTQNEADVVEGAAAAAAESAAEVATAAEGSAAPEGPAAPGRAATHTRAPHGVDVLQTHGATVLRPWGELDLQGASAIRPALDQAVNGGARRYILDMRDVRFIDSSGLQELERAMHVVQAKGGQAIVTRVQPRVKKTMDVSGMTASIGGKNLPKGSTSPSSS